MINILYNCFKHWSEAGSVYIYSDTHFSDVEHFKLLKANNKVPEGINSVEELDELQIKNINEIVHRNDTLILLGDVGNIEYIKRLKAGKKILITGNHDRDTEYYQRRITYNEKFDPAFIGLPDNSYKPLLDNKLFDEVYAGPLMISDKIILSHEPIVPCPRYLVNLHGHTHDRPDVYEFVEHLYYNFCAEAIGFRPVSLGELIKHGLLSHIDDIHRVAIDRAIERKNKKEK